MNNIFESERYLSLVSVIVIDFIRFCQLEDQPSSKEVYSSRYIGSLVADFHRNLIKGGVYLYPSTKRAPNGKLRLTYECSPLAFIIEQAGGRAISESERIMDIQPKELHERVPFFVGSKNMIDKLEDDIKPSMISFDSFISEFEKISKEFDLRLYNYSDSLISERKEPYCKLTQGARALKVP